MSIVLPENRLAATRTNPKILLLYGLPKVGKTDSLVSLDNCLILDLEGGAEMYEALRVQVRSIKDIDDVIALIMEKGKANGGKYPYKYIAVDTISKLEDYAEVAATTKYKATTIGKTFKESSVLELPKGGGYYHLRNEVILNIDRLSRVCQHLILIAHVKEKLMDKAGVETTQRDIDLSGKLSGIVSAKADAIGYMYRDDSQGGKLMVSFKTPENVIMGARFPHLRGQLFPFDWDKIFLPNNVSAETAETP